MWSSRLAIVFAGAVLLAACGFRPLYSRGDGDAPGVTSYLQSIQVDLIADRSGQLLHNRLLDLLNPRGRPVSPQYLLKVRLSEGTESLAVQKNAFATRANLTVRARILLYPARSQDKPIYAGDSLVVSSYNILNSDFATLMAEKDARSRAIREVANDIRTKLSVYFTEPAT